MRQDPSAPHRPLPPPPQAREHKPSTPPSNHHRDVKDYNKDHRFVLH